MDLPILKHLDTLIGLAVVMLIASTVIVAITQFILSCRSARSSYLREMLSDLILQIVPKFEKAEARYAAERLLRHPLVGRSRWLDARRTEKKSGLPLPKVARGEVILRHEIIVALLEWAAAEGPMSQQDRELAGEKPQAQVAIQALVEKLREALRDCGVADPVQAVRDMRANVVEYENANPGQPSQVWQTQALVRTGLGDLTGRVFSWYDNSMERVTEFFSLEAKVITSVIGFFLCFAIQLDSVDLLRRLSQDDKLRAALVAKAETAKKAYEDLTAPGAPQPDEAKREQAKKAINESVDSLRDTNVMVVPDAFLWDRVAQFHIWATDGKTWGQPQLELWLDGRKFDVTIPTACKERFPACPASQLRESGAPVLVFEGDQVLTVVARSTAVHSVALVSKDGQVEKWRYESGRIWDGTGFNNRFGGVLLSWILLSLGAPFWYDLLKKLLGLRSILQSKDEAERAARTGEQAKPAERADPVLTTAAPVPLSGNPTGVILYRAAALRSQPNTKASVTRDLPADYLLNVEGLVQAEPVPSATGVNPQWYRTVQGDYLWAGDAKPVVTAGDAELTVAAGGDRG